MIKTSSIILGPTAQKVTPSDEIYQSISLSIQNTDSSLYAYIGNSSVTTENYGFRLSPGATFAVNLGPYDELYVAGDEGCTASIIVLDK